QPNCAVTIRCANLQDASPVGCANENMKQGGSFWLEVQHLSFTVGFASIIFFAKTLYFREELSELRVKIDIVRRIRGAGHRLNLHGDASAVSQGYYFIAQLMR